MRVFLSLEFQQLFFFFFFGILIRFCFADYSHKMTLRLNASSDEYIVLFCLSDFNLTAFLKSLHSHKKGKNDFFEAFLTLLLFCCLQKQIPLSHISEKVYKTSIDWIGQRSSDALLYFIRWSLDSVLDDLAIHQGVAKGSKKVAQQAPSKSQVSFSRMLRVYCMLLNL